tara:strand:+ start:20 stop:292 length:273 start_codon:yes stop_codon:yes gene_type:complete
LIAVFATFLEYWAIKNPSQKRVSKEGSWNTRITLARNYGVDGPFQKFCFPGIIKKLVIGGVNNQNGLLEITDRIFGLLTLHSNKIESILL